MLEAEEFPTVLASRLLQGNHFRVYHVSTAPKACPPVFAPGPGRSDEATTLESHFLAISQPPSLHHQNSTTDPSDVLVLGVEVLIFTTNDLTTVFVSKADSTGLLTRAIKHVSRRMSLAQTAITAFLDYLLKPRLDRGRLVLSLFARSQNQYLFPGSIENATKHVLDDRELIKWWCRLLHPLARQASDHASRSVTAHVVVPGCDSSETKVFFPSAVKTDLKSKSMWSTVYPVNLLVRDTALPTRCLVPRLPDDPKSRFLDDLDAHRDVNGDWRGIKTLDQFWEMMSYRQECSAGRLVGFVWVVISSSKLSKESSTPVSDEILRGDKNDEHELVGRGEQLATSKVHNTTSAPTSVQQFASATNSVPAELSGSSDRVDIRSTAPVPGIVRTTAALAGPSTALPQTLSVTCQNELDDLSEQKAIPSTGAVVMTSEPSQPNANLLLSAENYQCLMDELLGLDFAGDHLAVESTRKWREKAMTLAGVAQFGVEMEGIMVETNEAMTPPDVVVHGTATANLLTGVRRKRKPSQAETNVSDPMGGKPGVNTLPTNLVRKKPKA